MTNLTLLSDLIVEAVQAERGIPKRVMDSAQEGIGAEVLENRVVTRYHTQTGERVNPFDYGNVLQGLVEEGAVLSVPVTQRYGQEQKQETWYQIP